MPFLTENQTSPGGLAPHAATSPDIAAPDFLAETLPAAFREGNIIGALAESARGWGPRSLYDQPQPGFDPFTDIAGYEDHAQSFVGAETYGDVRRIKAKINREQQDRETLAVSGWQGMAAGLAAGLVDPINLIPVGGTVHVAGRLGWTSLRGAATAGTAGLLASTASETLLHATQETRDWGDSVRGIGWATVLSGVLGGAAPLVRAGVVHGREAVSIGRDRRAIGSLYEAALSDPEGKAIGMTTDRHVMELDQVSHGLKRIAVDRGEGLFRQNGALKIKTNFGLVKVIWKHGVESPEAADPALAHMVVTKDDVLDVARIVRRFEPEVLTDAEKGMQRWQWAVERKGAGGTPRQVIYSIRRFTHADDADHVVTVYVPKPGEEAALSQKRGKAGAGAGSLSESLRPVQDPAGEPLSQHPQGRQQAAPESNIALQGKEVTTAPDSAPAIHPAAHLGGDGIEDLAAAMERDMRVPPADDPPVTEFIDMSTPADVASTGGSVGGSVGAAASRSTSLEQETIKSALGAENLPVIRSQDPIMRALHSPVVAVRQTIQRLAETPLKMAKNADGLASDVAVETRIKMWQAPLAQAAESLDDLFVQYRLGRTRHTGDVARIGLADTLGHRDAGILGRKEFLEEVGRSMRRGDGHAVPEVARAARTLRETVFDPLKDKAIEAGLLPEDVSVDTALSYLTRVYDPEKVVRRRPEFEGRIVSWLGERRADAGRRLRDAEAKAGELDPQLQRIETELGIIDGTRGGAMPNDAGELQLTERAWKDHRFATVARERDLAAARRAFRQADRDLSLARARQEAFRPDDMPKGDPLTQVLRDIRRGGPKPPESLASWVRRNGGLQDEGGEVRALGLGDHRLVNGKSGMALDDASRKAAEEGFFSGHGGERPSIDDFLWALKDDASGTSKLYRASDLEAAAYGDYVADFAHELDRMGIDIRKPDAEIKAMLDAAQAGEPVRYRASTPAARAKAREIGYHLRRAEDRHAAANERLHAAGAALAECKAARDQARLDYHGLVAKAAHLDGELRKTRTALGRAHNAVEAEKGLAAADDLELKDIARQVTDHILSVPAGRIPYEAVPLARGPLKDRTLAISDFMIEDFLDSDALAVARRYVHTMAPDVELSTAFGRADMQGELEKVAEHYAVLREGVTDEKALKELDGRLRGDLRDLVAVRDRLRGTYAMPDNPHGLAVRAARVVRSINFLRLLGGMTISSLADAARPVMVHGLTRTVGDGLAPLVTNLNGFRLAAEEAKLAGTALDMVLDTRAMQLVDVWDDYGRLTKFERGLEALTSQYGLVTLMAPWNTFWKQFTGVISQTRMLQAIERYPHLAPGSRELENLAFLGIDPNGAERIARQFSMHGVRGDNGAWWANTRAWTDAEAVDAFRAALVKDIDRTIVTPGQDKPLWMSTELGKMIGQFKSFSLASTQRVALAALQDRDAATLNGVLMSVGLGMMSYAVYGTASGQALSDDPAHWVREGFDRSGLLFWLSDLNNVAGKWFGFTGSSRYASRGVVDSLLGPTAGLANDAVQVTGDAARGQWTGSDTHTMRRLMPLQNLFYLRRLFDSAEEGVNGALGVPMAKGR